MYLLDVLHYYVIFEHELVNFGLYRKPSADATATLLARFPSKLYYERCRSLYHNGLNEQVEDEVYIDKCPDSINIKVMWILLVMVSYGEGN